MISQILCFIIGIVIGYYIGIFMDGKIDNLRDWLYYGKGKKYL
jgi:hypothetical protein